jgi:AhpD family alkylhydroperoxidase
VRCIAATDFGLLHRCDRLFAFLDPNRPAPTLAYPAVRLRGSVAADCGGCVEADIAVARRVGVSDGEIDALLAGRSDALTGDITAAARRANAVVRRP